MSAAQSLDLVIRLATDRRDAAALELAGSRRQGEAARRKLEMLSRYLDEYLARTNGGMQAGGTDPVRVANTRAFIDKLDQAIALQQREVEACEAKSASRLQVLTTTETGLKSLEMLRDRRIGECRRDENRREQKRSDEFGARAARSGGSMLDFSVRRT